MKCSEELRAEGKAYPRTCPVHGLFGKCPKPKVKKGKKS